MKTCKSCTYRQHPTWAILIPGYMICNHPKSTVGRLDIERMMNDNEHCGPDAKWWEEKNDNT
jgi:hypothetical protein